MLSAGHNQTTGPSASGAVRAGGAVLTAGGRGLAGADATGGSLRLVTTGGAVPDLVLRPGSITGAPPPRLTARAAAAFGESGG
jgi:hypothetical protein